MFENRVAYGKSGYPWSAYDPDGLIKYGRGTMPVAEKLQYESYLGLNLCEFEFSDQEIDLVIAAFHKVWANMGELED